MSVCLVALPSPFLIDEKVFPPLGILYVAQALRLQGKDVYVHDGAIEDIPTGFHHYGISATTPQFPLARKALQHIRTSGKYQSCRRVFIGGPHATVDPESCLAAGFDGVVMGEGEVAAKIAVDFCARRIEAPMVWSPDMMPARELIDIKSYHYTIEGRPATSVMTTRGCPYTCGFCCKSTGRVKLFPAEHVIAELQHLKDEYGYTAFMFFDDIFILDVERFVKISEWLKCNDIKWRAFTRADLLVKGGEELVKRMKETGCVEVGIGVESGSPLILQKINKGEDIFTMKKGIWLLQKAGIRVKGFFIVGLPSENWCTIEQTKQFLDQMHLDDCDFSIFTPYKGSHIYEHREEYDIFFDNADLEKLWYKGKAGEYESLVSTTYLTRKEIVQARDELERTYKK